MDAFHQRGGFHGGIHWNISDILKRGWCFFGDPVGGFRVLRTRDAKPLENAGERIRDLTQL